MTIDKKMNYEMQGNEKPARNYLGKQKTVTVPVKWQSNPKAPKTELAYITKAEKDLILKKNLHGSLKNGPNTGPSGIMSLDSQGDYTRDRSPGAYTGGGGSPNQQSQSTGTSQQALRNRAMNEKHMKEILTGQKDIGQTSRVSDRVRERAVPEYAFGPDGKRKYIGSSSKWVGPSLFNRSGYRDIQNKRGGFFGFGGQKDIQFNPATGRYEFEEEETGDVKPGMGGRFFGGLMSLLTGVPVVGSAIGTAYDYGKGIFGKKQKDMSQYNQLGLFGEVDEDFNRNRNISTDMGDSAWKDGTFTWGADNNKGINENIFSYKDDLPNMKTTDFNNPNNFNVNQNYKTTGALPNSEYPTSINQNMLTDEDYEYFQNSLKNGGLAGLL
jgi:hypothetical protein